jgi:hypothetical protein
MIIFEVPSVEPFSTCFTGVRSKGHNRLTEKNFYFSWKCLRSWSFRFPSEENILLQWEHLKGFSPVWSLMCTFRFDFSIEVFGQNGHLKIMVIPWFRCFCLKWVFSRWYREYAEAHPFCIQKYFPSELLKDQGKRAVTPLYETMVELLITPIL